MSTFFSVLKADPMSFVILRYRRSNEKGSHHQKMFRSHDFIRAKC